MVVAQEILGKNSKYKKRYIFIFSFLFLNIYLCYFNSEDSSFVDYKVLDLAHRGYASKNKESTIKAFEYALNQHTDGLEFDIRQTIDNIRITPLPLELHPCR